MERCGEMGRWRRCVARREEASVGVVCWVAADLVVGLVGEGRHGNGDVLMEVLLGRELLT
jgi:hypothetical protein